MPRKFTFESLDLFDALETKLSMSGLVAGLSPDPHAALGTHIPPEPDPGPLPPSDPPIILPPIPPSVQVGLA
jgi:hypothetical protein